MTSSWAHLYNSSKLRHQHLLMTSYAASVIVYFYHASSYLFLPGLRHHVSRRVTPCQTNITPIPSFVTGATRRRLLTSRQHPSRSLALKLWVLSTILPCTTTATRLCSWSTRKDTRDMGACRSLTTPSSSSVTREGVRLRSSVQTVNPQASRSNPCYYCFFLSWCYYSFFSLFVLCASFSEQ